MIKKSSFTFIMGPCVIEDLGHAVRHATFLRKVSDEFHVPIIYKSSYTKDNRTSKDSPRGPGVVHGMDILRQLHDILPVCTDVHSVDELDIILNNGGVTLLQIPAMLSRQTSLLEEAGTVGSQVMIKKMTTMVIDEIYHAAEKVGRSDTVLCERGTFHGYGKNVIDFQNVINMVASPYSVVVDVTHPALYPSYALPLAKAACALKVDGIFCEVHENPSTAPSDGARMLRLDQVEHFVEQCLKVRWA